MKSVVVIPIEFELTDRSRALIDALAKLMPARLADEKPEATAAAPATKLPAIGARWPGQDGVYAGISAGEDGQPDGHLVLLDVKPEKDLDWPDGVKWAEGLGDGARLPTRFESALLYANVRSHLDTSSWHWTGTQSSDCYAWFQYFYYGDQYDDDKKYQGRCRAVRRFVL